MTVIGDSRMMRKAYLGFLLAAKLHSQNNNDWRMSRSGEDVFAEAEEWEQKIQSSDPKQNTARDSRNPDPTHVAPSSQGSIASVI